MSFLTSSSKIAGLEQQISELQTSLTTITGERDEAKTTLATVTTERDQAKSDLVTVTGERDQAKGDLVTVTGERDQLRTDKTALEGEIATLKQNTSSEVRKQVAEAGVPAVARVDNPSGSEADAGAGRTKTTWAKPFGKR